MVVRKEALKRLREIIVEADDIRDKFHIAESGDFRTDIRYVLPNTNNYTYTVVLRYDDNGICELCLRFYSSYQDDEWHQYFSITFEDCKDAEDLLEILNKYGTKNLEGLKYLEDNYPQGFYHERDKLSSYVNKSYLTL
jgi:hypothetical protein